MQFNLFFVHLHCMSIQDIIDWFTIYSNQILAYFLIVFAATLIGSLFVNKENFQAPITYIYSVLVYSIAIPGILALILLLYSFFFLQTNLLQLNVVTHFAPVIAAIITLTIINKTIPMSNIPGFNKLSGLFFMIIITLIITYILQKMFFGVFFVGKIQYLLAFFILLFFGIKIAWTRLTK